MSDVELKPCPFCGSDEVKVQNFLSEAKYYGILCCECDTRACTHFDRESVIKAWNTRATECEKCKHIEKWCDHFCCAPTKAQRYDKLVAFVESLTMPSWSDAELQTTGHNMQPVMDIALRARQVLEECKDEV